MKGLELAEGYFRAFGAPMIAEKFGVYQHRIAAGLVGEGSDCFGFDDEISRDHDWGPAFCLWLEAQDYAAIGPALAAEVARLPATFEGFGPRQVTERSEGRVGVLEIGSFYSRFVGLDHPPSTIRQWRAIPESYLAVATNGRVFTDSLGTFTAFRDALKAYYPEDVRLKKIAARCTAAAQAGQYNFGRCVRRKELVAAQCAEAQFFTQIISLVFLLNRQYTPYYKWMHRAMQGLPILGEHMHRALSEIAASFAYARKVRLIDEVCMHVIEELRRQGLSDSSSDYLLDHGPLVQAKIEDADLRAVDVLLE